MGKTFGKLCDTGRKVTKFSSAIFTIVPDPIRCLHDPTKVFWYMLGWIRHDPKCAINNRLTEKTGNLSSCRIFCHGSATRLTVIA